MVLHSLSCIAQEFLRSIAAFLSCTPDYSGSFMYCVGDRTG
jgi:hypothetical protein